MNIAYIANPNSVHDAKWINHFAKANNVIVLSSLQKDLESSLEAKIPVFPFLPGVFPYRNPFKKKKLIKKIKAIIEEYNISIIHSMYAYPNALWASEIKFKNHIVTTRGSDILIDYQNFRQPSLRYFIPYTIYKRKIESALNNAKFITSTSERQQKVITDFIKKPQKLRLIRTGVDSEYFLHKYENSSNKVKENVIFSLRGIAPNYRTLEIIEAFNIIVKDFNQNLNLFLASYPCDNNYLALVKEKIEKLTLTTQVKILPKLSQNEMIQVYKDTTIVVSIPKSDGTPVSLVEAMILKKPIVMNKGNYDSDLFNKDTIWQIEGETKSSIANMMRQAIEQSKSSSKIDKAFKAALENADLNVSLKKVESLYKNCL